MYKVSVNLDGESQIILQLDQNALELKIEKAYILSLNYPYPYYELPNLSPLYNHKIHTEKAYRENHSNIWVWTRTSIG